MSTTGRPGLHEVVAGVHVVDVTRPGSLAAVIDPDDDSPVLVASHPVHAHASRVACTVLVANRPEVPVAHVSFGQAPLASLLAMAMARDVARDAGHGAAVWRDLSDATWSAAIVPGVAKLPAPNPSLRQHVRSMLPGSRYLVRLHPEPEAIGRKQVAGALVPVGRGLVQAYSTRLDQSDELLGRILSQVAPLGVELREVPSVWESLFGRREDLQLALVPADFQRMLRPRGVTCRSCGLSTIDPVCVYCRLRVPGVEDLLLAPEEPESDPGPTAPPEQTLAPTGRTP